MDAVPIIVRQRLALADEQPVHSLHGNQVLDRLQVLADRHQLAQVNVEGFAFAFRQPFKQGIAQMHQPFRPAGRFGDNSVVIVTPRLDFVGKTADRTAFPCAAEFRAVGSAREHVRSGVVFGHRNVRGLDCWVVVIAEHHQSPVSVRGVLRARYLLRLILALDLHYLIEQAEDCRLAGRLGVAMAAHFFGVRRAGILPNTRSGRQVALRTTRPALIDNLEQRALLELVQRDDFHLCALLKELGTDRSPIAPKNLRAIKKLVTYVTHAAFGPFTPSTPRVRPVPPY